MLNISVARVCSLLLLLFVALPVVADTDQERAEALFQEGYILYQQRYSPNAFTKFKEAAQLGHAEAAYYAGNILRRNSTYITAEAEEFYRQAAEDGDVYAMLRFAQKGKMCGTLRDCDYDREEWLDRAMELALPKAEAGDTEAMMALSSAFAIDGDPDKDFEWVERAAESGHAFAQYWMAVMLDEQDRGFYWTEKGRREDVLKWLNASAEQGFPKAILKLAVELKEDGRFEEANEWVGRMGQTDYYDALVNYGLILLEGPDGMFRHPETKPVEGLAMLMALHRQMGKFEVKEFVEQYKADLSAKDITRAEKRSEELLVDTPIIYYLPKFGM
ncbi:tetratricopeptide repeat protein [Marinobacter sp. HL-58]|uniref:tetratricopeptide repeat protein n=1 Tax=Marinobacter sp. HL-58 TaxID=1479237 RepID=UPI000489AEDA|nr:tetratricopeptide repeat protein [Marinobacter sp. HL-58]KPQ01910.1 MAG: Sel1 repeat [Marinobacter sp. HL-58]